MSTPTQQPASLDYIVERWREGLSIGEIANEVGVTRQRISQRLIEAGYSPALRRAEGIAAREGHEQTYKAQRAENLARRAEAREAACDRLIGLARELGVSPYTLAQYAARSGPYATRRSGVHPKAGRYGTGRLPPRDTPEGKQLAERVAATADPWSAMHLSNIASRRPR